MATTGQDISKDLAVIKGQLSATSTRLKWIMIEHGNELLLHDSGQEKEKVPLGIHVSNLLLKLEIYREHVDKFTSAVRKKYGMPELKIRKDTHELRSQFMDQLKELEEEVKGLSPGELTAFLDNKIASAIK